MSNSFRCDDHQIQFPNMDSFHHHMSEQCEIMLKNKNSCTFLKENGRCCGKSFQHTATLLYHYYKVHDIYACHKCYSTYQTLVELDDHTHKEAVDVRNRKKNYNFNRAFNYMKSLYRSVCLLFMFNFI